MAARNAFDNIIGQGADGFAQAVNNFIKGLEYFISEATFTDFFPDLFNRIHLRSIWRKRKNLNISWD